MPESSEIKTVDPVESKKFAERVEHLIKKEKKNLVWREMLASILSPVKSILSPWTSQGGAYLSGYAGLGVGSDYIRELKDYAQDIDYRNISNRLFSEFGREAAETMPEVEREVKNADFLKNSIGRLTNEAMRYVRSKSQLTGGLFGIAVSMLAMSVPTLLKASTLGGMGTATSLLVTAGIAGTSTAMGLVSSYSVAKRRRQEMKVHNENVLKAWREADKTKYATLANPALKANTNSSSQSFQKLEQTFQEEMGVFKKATISLKSALNKISGLTLAINAGVLGACYLTGMDIATMATVFMGVNVMNNSAIKMLDASFRLKETSDNMFMQYKKFCHSKVYDLIHGKQKAPEHTDTIQLKNICYCLRYSGTDTEKVGLVGDIPVIQSINTITFRPGINVLGGASGAGKSTLYKLLRHADDLKYGSISYGTQIKEDFVGVKLTDMPKDEPNRHISFCFQEIENDGQSGIALIRQANPDMPPEHIEEIGAELGLSFYKETPEKGREEKLFREMSGGEKKRVLFLQTLLSPKRILVFDEPTSGVDRATADKMLTMLNNDYIEIDGKKEKRTIIYTTHHADELRLLNVTQVVDLDSIKDANRIDSFIQEHGITRLPTEMTIHPFTSNQEKEDYILLTASRSKESRSEKSETPNNIQKYISLSICKRLDRERESTEEVVQYTPPEKDQHLGFLRRAMSAFGGKNV